MEGASPNLRARCFFLRIFGPGPVKLRPGLARIRALPFHAVFVILLSPFTVASLLTRGYC